MTEIVEGYKQTDVGVIPKDWDVQKVQDIGHIKTGPFGTLLKANEYSYANGTPLISVREIGEGILRLDENTPLVPPSVVRRLPEYVLNSGDIVFGRKGAVNRSALVNESQSGWFLGSDGIRLRSFKTFYPPFIACQFQRKEVQTWLLQNATGTTMASLNQEILRRVSLPIPPIPEQKAIAQALSDVDAAIAAIDRLITKKRNIKQGTMQQLLTGKKRLPGFSGEWEVKKLGEMVNKIVGGGTPSRNKKEYWNGNIFWATVKDITSFCPYETEEKITQEGLNFSASNLIQKGTLILSTRMAVGKVVIYDVDVAINQDLKAIITKPDIDTKFLFYCFIKHCSIIDFLSSGSTVKGIIVQDLKSIEFPYISLPEQKAIAQILSDMDTEIEALEQKRNKYKAIKQGMMQELLTGRTRLI